MQVNFIAIVKSLRLKLGYSSYRLKAAYRSSRIVFDYVLIGLFIRIKSFTDSFSVSDSAYFTYQKETQDSVVYLADYLSSSVSKIFEDSLFCVDSVGKLSQLFISDIISLSDSGILLSQDYVDNMYYFASDYVGEKRIF